MVANAEIYNFTEIRAELPAAKFTTNSDCESALHLWRDRGPAFTASLRGMYAMAIYDRGTGCLTLCRDPFGIKPLYTAKIASGIAFASEPQALLAAGLARRDVLPAGPHRNASNAVFRGPPHHLPRYRARAGLAS